MHHISNTVGCIPRKLAKSSLQSLHLAGFGDVLWNLSSMQLGVKCVCVSRQCCSMDALMTAVWWVYTIVVFCLGFGCIYCSSIQGRILISCLLHSPQWPPMDFCFKIGQMYEVCCFSLTIQKHTGNIKKTIDKQILINFFSRFAHSKWDKENFTMTLRGPF